MSKDTIALFKTLAYIVAIVFVLVFWPFGDKSLLDVMGPFIMIGVFGLVIRAIKQLVRHFRPAAPEDPTP